MADFGSQPTRVWKPTLLWRDDAIELFPAPGRNGHGVIHCADDVGDVREILPDEVFGLLDLQGAFVGAAEGQLQILAAARRRELRDQRVALNNRALIADGDERAVDRADGVEIFVR